LCFGFLLAAPSFAENAPGEIVVRFRPGTVKIPKGLAVASIREATVSVASVKELNRKHGVSQLRQLYRDALAIRPDWKQLENQYVLTFPKERRVEDAVADYKKDPNVLYASPNTRVRAFIIPNDPYYSQQWALGKISAPQGWDKTTGSPGVIIAILDTGLNYQHEEFTGAKLDLSHAKNYVDNTGNIDDDYGHGTAVAGVLGAIGNNAKGIAGVNWQTTILPLKVLDNTGGGNISWINEALADLAALKSTGLNIAAVNMSFGQYTANEELQQRCAEAAQQGMVLLAAAGNGDVDWPTYPAYYSSVVAVAAVDAADKKAKWTGIDQDTGRTQASNYGDWVDIAAPGSDIFTTTKDGGYSISPKPLWNGTSLATPFVAGLVGLVKAIRPSLSAAEIIEYIKDNSDEIDSLQEAQYAGKLGAGRINVQKAVSGFKLKITAPRNGAYIKGAQDIAGTATAWDFNNYQIKAVSGGSVEVNITNGSSPVESGTLGSWATYGLNGPFTIELNVFASDLSSREAAISVVVDNTTPEAAIHFPAGGSSVGGTIMVTGEAADPYFDYYTLEYGAGSDPLFYTTMGTFYSSVDAGALGTWETAGLSGSYTLRLKVFDKAGTVSTTSETINILEARPTKEVQPQTNLPPTFALPNPFDRSVSGEVSFSYKLEGNFNATIYLFDLNGGLIWRRTFAAGENGGKWGQNDPVWNGNNLFSEKVPNGLYFYQITADQKIIGRGKIIVL
jgi:thermitase